jgi:predicted RNA-binding Zn-ribbon protein involved in translation (DUF1610 family)
VRGHVRTYRQAGGGLSCGAADARQDHAAPMTDAYRRPPPGPPDRYMLAWGKLRRRRRGLVVGALAFPLLMAVVIPLMVQLGVLSKRDQRPPLLFFVIIGVSVSFFMRFAVFPCPHCGGQMKVLGTVRRREAERCPRCGIAVGTPQSEASGGRP